MITTVDRRETADLLAESSVELRLAACARVSGPVSSVYRWKGSIEREQEYEVVLKTTAQGSRELVGHLKSSHSYENPEIVIVPILGGSKDYLDWIKSETGP